MNVFFWILQIVLALHTLVGAVWKWSSSEHTMPSLGAIPHGLWLGMSIVELLCAAALLVPVTNERLKILTPVAAAVIAAEMLFFTGVHLASGSANVGPVMYWLVVAALCAVVAYGRIIRKPARRGEFA